jgi:hypothetical protein
MQAFRLPWGSQARTVVDKPGQPKVVHLVHGWSTAAAHVVAALGNVFRVVT